MADLWGHGDKVSEYIDVPEWVDGDIAVYDVAAIIQGGCASGAYMPAVTYHTASETMGRYGDDVLDYITEVTGELPPPCESESWSGMACHYLSAAVELWTSSIEETLSDAIDAEADED